MHNIVLASLSPRRKELLSQLKLDFIVDSLNIEEVLNDKLPLEERLMDLAYQKASVMLHKYPNEIIIGADTIVVYNNQILGKPKDYNDAYRMLKSYSKQAQIVYSAVCVLNKDKVIKFICQSKVYFKELTDEIIYDYLSCDEYKDKAGSYAIQGKGRQLIDHYEGDFNTIVGLPIDDLKEVLINDFNIQC